MRLGASPSAPRRPPPTPHSGRGAAFPPRWSRTKPLRPQRSPGGKRAPRSHSSRRGGGEAFPDAFQERAGATGRRGRAEAGKRVPRFRRAGGARTQLGAGEGAATEKGSKAHTREHRLRACRPGRARAAPQGPRGPSHSRSRGGPGERRPNPRGLPGGSHVTEGVPRGSAGGRGRSRGGRFPGRAEPRTPGTQAAALPIVWARRARRARRARPSPAFPAPAHTAGLTLGAHRPHATTTVVAPVSLNPGPRAGRSAQAQRSRPKCLHASPPPSLPLGRWSG